MTASRRRSLIDLRPQRVNVLLGAVISKLSQRRQHDDRVELWTRGIFGVQRVQDAQQLKRRTNARTVRISAACERLEICINHRGLQISHRCGGERVVMGDDQHGGSVSATMTVGHETSDDVVMLDEWRGSRRR